MEEEFQRKRERNNPKQENQSKPIEGLKEKAIGKMENRWEREWPYIALNDTYCWWVQYCENPK
jgi:hypothetical protein